VLETDVANFTIAAWWSLKAGLKHFTKWKRIAVVSDQKGVEWFSNAFTAFIPGKAKGFSLSEIDEAVKWISANN
jgi:hypothetical protein